MEARAPPPENGGAGALARIGKGTGEGARSSLLSGEGARSSEELNRTRDF